MGLAVPAAIGYRPSVAPRVTPRAQRAIDQAARGVPLDTIASSVGAAPRTVYKWLLAAWERGELAERPTAPPPPVTERSQRALELLRAGMSLAEVGRELGVAESQVSRWRAHHPPPPRPAAPAAAEEPSGAPVLDVAEGASRVEQLRARLAYLDRLSQAAAADGMHGVAARHSRDAIALEALISRAEDRQGGQGGLVVTEEQTRAAAHGLAESVRALCDRPLLCAACSRKLSIDWGDLSPEKMALVNGETTK